MGNLESYGGDVIVKQKCLKSRNGTIVDDIKVVLPLYEVSPCTFPAYKNTEIHARNKQTLLDYQNEKRENFKAWKKTILNKIKGEK